MPIDSTDDAAADPDDADSTDDNPAQLRAFRPLEAPPGHADATQRQPVGSGEPGPNDSADAPPSRRGVLVVGAALLAAAVGGGIATGIALRPNAASAPHADGRDVGELTAAIAAERALLDGVSRAGHSTNATSAQHAALLRLVIGNHRAHLQALEAVLAHARAADQPAGPTRRPRLPSGPAGDLSTLRTAERRAAAAAAARALRLTGAPAALLASIAACEATHAEALQ